MRSRAHGHRIRGPISATLLTAISLCLATRAAPAPRSLAWWAGDRISDGWLYGGDDDFVVATVVAVQDSGSTNANPPRVTIRVREVLRGSLRRGKHVIEWPPPPLVLQCGVGEDAHIRQWKNTPLKGPGVGRRMILGGSPGPSGVWQSDWFLRWDDSAPEAAEVRHKIAEWTPNVVARQLRERPEKERQRARAEEQARKEGAARARAEKDQKRDDGRKLALERSIRKSPDIDRLVRTSDAVFLSPPPIASAARGAAWGRFAVMHPSTWLLAPPRPQVRDTLVAVLFGQREDSLLARWLAAPADDRPGSESGHPLACLAFLRYAQNVIGSVGPDPLLRPVDPVTGILWADSSVVERARRAIARHATRPPEPPAPCGAALGEFAVRDSLEATEIGLKLSPLDLRDSVLDKPAVVLVASAPGAARRTTFDPGSFVPCAFPDEQYMHELRFAWSLSVRPSQMKALIDSLLSLPELVQGRIDPADSVTLSLRRFVGGRERIYETTLDDYTRWQLCRITRSIFRGDGSLAWNLGGWWNEIDRRLGELWNAPAPPGPRPRTLGAEVPELDPKLGSVVGWVRDADTGEPVPGASLRIFSPPLVVVTDDEGGYALRHLSPGTRWLQITSSQREMGVGFLTFRGGQVDTVVVRLGLKSPSPPRDTTFDRRERWLPGPSPRPARGARLAVRVRGEDDAPIAHASVVVMQGTQRFGALADSAGRLSFPAVPPGRGELIVRAAGRRSVHRTLRFEDAGCESLDVGLRREKGGPIAR